MRKRAFGLLYPYIKVDSLLRKSDRRKLGLAKPRNWKSPLNVR
jgi:hypothetical protein